MTNDGIYQFSPRWNFLQFQTFPISSTDPIAWNDLYISSNSHEEEEEKEEGERKAMKGCEFTAGFKCIAPYE